MDSLFTPSQPVENMLKHLLFDKKRTAASAF